VSAGTFVVDGPLLLAVPVAALAGLVSFASPCVLPLVPGYLSYVAGLSGSELAEREADPHRPAPTATTTTALEAGDTLVRVDMPVEVAEPRRRRRRSRVVLGAVLFVLGFTVVFIAYGAAFGSLGTALRRHERGLEQVLGVITIIMGLAFAGAFSKLMIANREWKPRWMPARGLAGAPALGALFGLGWTPCLGPTLAAVQGLALSSATAGRGATLSAAYCLGLGVPFVLVAVGMRAGLGALAVVRRHSRAVMIVGGVLLIVTGILEVTGEWNSLIIQLRAHLPGFDQAPL
jgi:cytochrome c-type biogenesis protein